MPARRIALGFRYAAPNTFRRRSLPSERETAKCPSLGMANLDMRIGELAQRSGVPAATLRAWERRYGILEPTRTPGGHRTYTARDLQRVRILVDRVDMGLSISAAAAEALRGGHEQLGEADIGPMAARLWAGIEAFELDAVRSLVADVIARWGVAITLDALLAPAFRRLGDEWRTSPGHVAREHFATTVVRAALLNYLPAGAGGPASCLAFCPEGENHDLGLVMAAISLAEAGWHPIVLGAHTPWASVEALLAELRPSLVVVGAQLRRPAARLLDQWSRPSKARVLLGGAGFRQDDAARFAASFHNGPYSRLGQAVTDSTGVIPG